MSLDKWECQRHWAFLATLRVPATLLRVLFPNMLQSILSKQHGELRKNPFQCLRAAPSSKFRNEGDIEFFFPHLDALPVERTLAAPLLNNWFPVQV